MNIATALTCLGLLAGLAAPALAMRAPPQDVVASYGDDPRGNGDMPRLAAYGDPWAGNDTPRLAALGDDPRSPVNQG